MAKTIPEHEALYSNLGRFIVAFTEVEKELTVLLKLLCDEEGNMWVGLFFIDDLMANSTKDKIEGVARLRLEDEPTLSKQLKEALVEFDTIRQRRNVLIHGEWKIDPTGRSITRVWNFKLKKTFVDKKKKGYFWEHLHETSVTSGDLTKLTKASELVAKTFKELTGKIAAYLKAEQERVDKLIRIAGSAMSGEQSSGQ